MQLLKFALEQLKPTGRESYLLLYTSLKENTEVTHNKDCFLKKTKILSVYGCHLFAFILLDAVKGEKLDLQRNQ